MNLRRGRVIGVLAWCAGGAISLTSIAAPEGGRAPRSPGGGGGGGGGAIAIESKRDDTKAPTPPPSPRGPNDGASNPKPPSPKPPTPRPPTPRPPTGANGPGTPAERPVRAPSPRPPVLVRPAEPPQPPRRDDRDRGDRNEHGGWHDHDDHDRYGHDYDRDHDRWRRERDEAYLRRLERERCEAEERGRFQWPIRTGWWAAPSSFSAGSSSVQHWTRSWNGEREVWVPIRPSDTDPYIGGDSLGRALSQPGGAAGFGGGTRFETWNSTAPSASVDSSVVVPREYIRAPVTGGPTLGLAGGDVLVVSEVDRERARAARERRVRLNAVYDVVPDVIASINAANAGDFVQGVSLMRRAALQNPDALVGERTPLDLLIERDPGFSQRVRWSLAAYQNPPSVGAGAIGDADALFMVAALSAALNQHEVARASVEAAIVREPDRVSTQGLRQALADRAMVDQAPTR